MHQGTCCNQLLQWTQLNHSNEVENKSRNRRDSVLHNCDILTSPVVQLCMWSPRGIKQVESSRKAGQTAGTGGHLKTITLGSSSLTQLVQEH